MLETFYIGSGDTAALLAGKQSKAHIRLLQRFVSGVKPYYNAKSSPIDAFRAGALLEDRFFLTLPEGYYTQVHVICPHMNVLKSSLDFARLENGKVAEFIEMKTCNFNDFLLFPSDDNERLKYIKRHYKDNYNQVQQQLLCSDLLLATIVFVVVYDAADDAQNSIRDILPNEYIKVDIERDEDVINCILDRALIFQQIKDYYTI